METLLYVLSGEFVLKCRSNGGTAVFMRSVFVTLLLYLPALGLRAYCEKNAVFNFSAVALRAEVHDTLPWIGAIFAGCYAAFYSRFAAQWSYLAGLYNQIMAVHISKGSAAYDDHALKVWKAGFVEDAIDLHLARKSMFQGVVKHYLSYGDIVHIFIHANDKNPERLEKLEKHLDFRAAKPALPTATTPASGGLAAPASSGP